MFLFYKMSEIRYYHGTKRSYNSPFAHEDKYTFWVYPYGDKPRNPWDTVMKATDYCNHHIDEGKAPDAPQLKQYVCLGHSKMEDMDVAKAEWKARGLKVEAEWAITPAVTKKYYHGCSLPREFPDGDNVFYMCSRYTGRWITNKQSAQEYCSNHTEVSLDKTRKDFPHGEHNIVRQFVCNGHDSCISGVWGDHLSFPDIKSGLLYPEDSLYPRFKTIAQQIHELEKGLEKSRVTTNDLQRETAELKLFMNKTNGSLNVLEVDDELKNQLTTQLAAENAELKSMMKDAIRRLDFLEQQLKKSTVEKATGPNVETVEKALPKPDDGNKYAYVYILPLLFALFVTLFTAKRNNPMLTTAHYPQITDNVD